MVLLAPIWLPVVAVVGIVRLIQRRSARDAWAWATEQSDRGERKARGALLGNYVIDIDDTTAATGQVLDVLRDVTVSGGELCALVRWDAEERWVRVARVAVVRYCSTDEWLETALADPRLRQRAEEDAERMRRDEEARREKRYRAKVRREQLAGPPRFLVTLPPRDAA